MISASHNPMPDNGIKLFSRGGHKLPDAVEAAIERIVGPVSTAADSPHRARHRPRPRPAGGGWRSTAEHLLATLQRPLDGLQLVVDCAHGAAVRRARRTSTAGPAPRVTAIGCSPDGWNINDGVGSTHLEPLIETVRESGADIGLAHDGDADRCLAVTAEGEVVDGDAILAICALALHERGALQDDTVVATVMSNLGFHHTMRGRRHRRGDHGGR